jgi:pimeloyl-ACP methyl ester carboxylesterase
MPTTSSNGLDIYYETMGDPADVPLQLVMGLSAQLIAWDDEFCAGLVDRGFFVIRHDNRDVGLSSKVETVGDTEFAASFAKALAGEAIEPPYSLSDMASDAVAVLDAVGVEAAHIVGASMGGMIAQTIAIEHPSRVLTLTSIMSTTGEPDVGQPTPAAMEVLLKPPVTERGAAIERAVESSRVIGSPDQFDEDRARATATAAFDRSFYPAGIARQLLGIVGSGSRADGLRALDVPTLVIHGTVDPLVTPTGGARTAELIPGAELLEIEGMGHDNPPAFWAQIIDAITTLAARATVSTT